MILQDLVRGKLLRSQPGPGGGYALAAHPERITILDVVNAVAPLERIVACPLGMRSHMSLCPLHRELDQAFAATEAALKRVTIAKLLQAPKSRVSPLCEVNGRR
jgi:Rrf2 family protein